MREAEMKIMPWSYAVLIMAFGIFVAVLIVSKAYGEEDTWPAQMENLLAMSKGHLSQMKSFVENHPEKMDCLAEIDKATDDVERLYECLGRYEKIKEENRELFRVAWSKAYCELSMWVVIIYEDVYSPVPEWDKPKEGVSS